VNETYSRVRAVKRLPDLLTIKNGLRQGAAWTSLLLNCALEYAVRGVQIKQVGLKVSGTHQCLVCADGVDLLGGSVHCTKKKLETRIEVNADKTKYILMYRYRNEGRSHNIKIDNVSFEMMVLP
jgi:hypothetical protein